MDQLILQQELLKKFQVKTNNLFVEICEKKQQIFLDYKENELMIKFFFFQKKKFFLPASTAISQAEFPPPNTKTLLSFKVEGFL